MSNKQPRLGRGLEALIPKTFLSTGKTISQLPVENIGTNPYQPRRIFDDEALSSLVDSIKRFGINQPILVRQLGDGYQLIAGERRLRASKKAGLVFVPAVVKNFSDKEALQFALVENLEREDLSPIETALGFKRLIDEFDMTHLSLGEMFDKSRSNVTNTLRLLNLPSHIQEALEKKRVTMGHARAILAMESPKEQEILFQNILNEGMNVRLAEASASHQKNKTTPKSTSNVQLALFSKMQQEIENVFEAKCKVSGKKNKGQITIYYQSEQELQVILERVQQFEKG